MEFEDAKSRLEEIRTNLKAEKDRWRDLLETVREKAEAGQGRVEAALNDQTENAARAQAVMGRLEQLRTVPTGPDSAALAEPIQNWLTRFTAQVQHLQTNLDARVPSFAMPTETLTEAANELEEQLKLKAEAIKDAVGDRLTDARDQIEANLTQSVTLVETSVEDLFEGVDTSIKEAIESLGALWQETGESIVTAKDAVLTTGTTTEEILKTATGAAIDKVTGNLSSLTERIDDLLATLQQTMTTLERALELVGEASSGTAVGMSGASSSLSVVRNIMSSVA